ncbi:MAG: hypothetical protein WCS99_10765 [Limisphaerales bacterium]
MEKQETLSQNMKTRFNFIRSLLVTGICGAVLQMAPLAQAADGLTQAMKDKLDASAKSPGKLAPLGESLVAGVSVPAQKSALAKEIAGYVAAKNPGLTELPNLISGLCKASPGNAGQILVAALKGVKASGLTQAQKDAQMRELIRAAVIGAGPGSQAQIILALGQAEKDGVISASFVVYARSLYVELASNWPVNYVRGGAGVGLGFNNPADTTPNTRN